MNRMTLDDAQAIKYGLIAQTGLPGRPGRAELPEFGGVQVSIDENGMPVTAVVAFSGTSGASASAWNTASGPAGN
jgi:hypothetical protein